MLVQVKWFGKRNTFYEGADDQKNDDQKNDDQKNDDQKNDDQKKSEEDKKKERQYTQAEVEKLLDSERVRVREQTRTQISQLEELKKKQSLTEEAKSNLQNQIDELNKTLLSKEELAKREKESVQKAAKEQIEILTKEKTTWETRYKESMMTQELVAASRKMDVFNPDVMVNLLWGKTRVLETKTEDGSPTGQYAVKVSITGQKDGKPQELSLDPLDAVKFIKDDPNYHFMFKGTAGNGVGGSGNPLIHDVDPSKMTPEQYRKHRDQIKKGLK